MKGTKLIPEVLVNQIKVLLAVEKGTKMEKKI
jgi:hypothetical protein